MYFYLPQIVRIYYMIRLIHGTYVSYRFVYWTVGYTYSTFSWFSSFIYQPQKQIDDVYYHVVSIDDDFLLIN
jgi:hypothetical protein